MTIKHICIYDTDFFRKNIFSTTKEATFNSYLSTKFKFKSRLMFICTQQYFKSALKIQRKLLKIKKNSKNYYATIKLIKYIIIFISTP